jgi:hypothetical protein
MKLFVSLGRVAFTFLGGSALLCLQISISEAAARDTKKWGIGVGSLVTATSGAFPLSSVLGYSVSRNLGRHLRLTFGYGALDATGKNFDLDIKTYGLNLKYFPFAWNFAPFLEFSGSYLRGSITGSGTISALSATSSGVGYGAGAGLDWQTEVGLNLGFGYKYLFAPNVQASTAPGIHVGWYF